MGLIRTILHKKTGVLTRFVTSVIKFNQENENIITIDDKVVKSINIQCDEV